MRNTDSHPRSGKGEGIEFPGERVFIEWEFAKIGQDSLFRKSFLLTRDLVGKQEVRAKLQGKRGWGISEIFLRQTPHVKEWSFSAGL
jgi:hypothetical protein